MRVRFTLLLIVLFIFACFIGPFPAKVAAQTSSLDVTNSSDEILMRVQSDGKVGIGTTNPLFKLSIANDGGIYAAGTHGSGFQLNFSPGTALLWYPRKSAFRVGFANGNWGDADIGEYSFAAGNGTKASGSYSTALGGWSTASGNASFAAGYFGTASALGATALGWRSTASGMYSLSLGRFVTASGQNSVVLGRGLDETHPLTNSNDNSLMIGFNSDSPTLYVGPSNGTSGSTGNVGVGTSSPNEKLTVNGVLSLGSTSAPSATSNFGKLYVKSTDNNLYFKKSDGTEIDLTAGGSGGVGGSGSPNQVALWNTTTSLSGTNDLYWDITNSRLGVGTSSPNEKLTVEGNMSLKETSTAPSASTGYGKLYVKSADKNLYFQKSDGSEVIISGGGNVTGSGTSGQISFWSGTNSQSGSNDLYWDNTNSKLGLGTTSPEFKLTLDNDGGIYASGTYGSGTQLSSSPDVAMLWYPRRAAFRVGIGDGEWDDADIGSFSFATGYGTKASGNNGSFAWGYHSTASGNISMAGGTYSTADGIASISLGRFSVANGDYSIALGNHASSGDNNAISIGAYVDAQASNSIVIGSGRINDESYLTNSNSNSLIIGFNSNTPTMFVSGGDGTAGSTGKVGIGTTAPDLKLTLDNDGGIIAKGTFGSGTTLSTSGEGTRFIWYPKKAALRAGYVSGDNWNDHYIGNYSVSFGKEVKAYGEGSIAVGMNSEATGYCAIAFGYNALATHPNSLAAGNISKAYGDGAISMGNYVETNANYSLTMGSYLKSNGFESFTIGTGINNSKYLENNIDHSLMVGFYSDTPTLFVSGGNGQSGSTGKVGIATTNPTNKLHVKSEINGNGSELSAYVAQIENTSTGSSPDVLALRIGTTGNPGTAANFVGFFDGDGDLIGQIEGNGSGGVTYNTSGADYAEWLPKLDPAEHFEPGEIVGVVNGKITRNTSFARQLLVISTAPLVLGNMPKPEESENYEKVAFLGQVPVKVRGPVQAGDYILPSGRNDGTGVAVAPNELRPEQIDRIVGIAWEGSSQAGVKKINTAVGFHSRAQARAIGRIVQQQQQQIGQLQHQMVELKQTLSQLQETIQQLAQKAGASSERQAYRPTSIRK